MFHYEISLHQTLLSQTISYLSNIALEALNSGNPRRYLERFSPFHLRFHTISPELRDVGFLSFHWCAIYYFRILGIDRIMNVVPYTVNDFDQGGIFGSQRINWRFLAYAVSSRSVGELIEYSRQVEMIHNISHMAIETVTGTPMMEPSLNIFYTAFWNLHFFINMLFEQQIEYYRQYTHWWLRTPYQVIQSIEQEYGQLMGRI